MGIVRILESLALVSAAMFAGGALYVSLVEHPARIRAGPAIALVQFRRMYPLAAPWQASSAALSLIFGIALWPLTGTWAWGVGGVLVGFAIPFTLIVVMPVNRRLLARAAPPDDDVTQLLLRWGRLHWIRSLLGALGLVAFVHAALWP
jgi:hypothetical protein